MHKLFLVIISLLTACSYIQRSPEYLNSKAACEERDCSKLGVLAFRYLDEPRVELSLVLKSLDSNRWYSVELNRRLLRSEGVRQERLRKMMSDPRLAHTNPFVNTIGLPPGRYLPVSNSYYISRDVRGTYLSLGDTIWIYRDSITSLGTIKLDVELNLFSKNVLNFYTTANDIDSLLRFYPLQELNQRGVSNQKLKSLQK